MKFNFLYRSPDGPYGAVINRAWMDDEGKMWITNGTGETQVNFCPFTGTPAKKQMKVQQTANEMKIYNNS